MKRFTNYNKKLFISLLIISLFVFFQIGGITTTAATLDNEEFYNSNSEDTTNTIEADNEVTAKKNIATEGVGSSYPPVTQEGDLNNILSYKVESYYDNGKITHSNLIIYSEEQSYYDAWEISERDFKRREGFIRDSLRIINIPEELNVTELTFDKINYIPQFYLKNYDKITTINFKNYTELYIAKDAFSGYYNVSWLNADSYDENKNYIPVKYIGNGAFYGCFGNRYYCYDHNDIIFAETMSRGIYPENVKPKHIPRYVTYMLGNSFNMSDSIVSKQNPKYYCDGDCIFERGTNKLIHARNIGCVPDWVDTLTYGSLSYDDEKKIVIPEHITKIESSVFYKCSTWIIDLPKSLKELDTGAFYCAKCYEINFPEKFDNTCNIVQNTIEKSEINSMNFRVPENCIITCWNFIKPYNAKEITILSDFPEMKLYNMYKIYHHIQKYSAILYGEDISGTDLELSEEEKAKRIEERSAYGNHPYYPDFFWRMPQYQQTYCYRSDESENKYDEFYFYRYKKTNEITTINTLSTCTNLIDYCKHANIRYAYRCLDTGEYWSPEMDFDKDSEVTIVDATTLQKYLAGFDISDYDSSMADCNKDGQISISDVTYIQRYLAGMQ